MKKLRTIELTYPHTLNLEALPKTVAAIGFFDGVHLGHQQVIEAAVDEAKKREMESAVISFFPHPSVVLKAGREDVKYITPLREKQEILQRLGVDRFYIITFNKELSSLSPKAFIDHFIIGLHIKHLVAGFDFTYGHRGQGTMEDMKEYADNHFTYSTITKVEMDKEKISSTRIRSFLAAGDMEKTAQLLGRPLSLYGMVVDGEKRGRTLGFPTANLKVNDAALLPKPGIYAVKVSYKNESYEGMASLGTNPTFTENRDSLSLEVYIFDYNNDLYGEELQLQWFRFIRDEQKFTTVDGLIKQMKNDEAVIRNYFSELPHRV